MNKKELLNNILAILKQVKEDKDKLEQIYDFFMEEIYDDEMQKVEIPEKYKKLVNDVVQAIDMGCVCYVNTQTIELVEIYTEMIDEYSSELNNDDDEIDEVAKGLKDDLAKIESWDKKIEIEPLRSNESYKIMEGFIDDIIPQGSFQTKLYNAINRPKPFAKFRYIVDDSDYLQDWYDYKKNYLEKYVWKLIMEEEIE